MCDVCMLWDSQADMRRASKSPRRYSSLLSKDTSTAEANPNMSAENPLQMANSLYRVTTSLSSSLAAWNDNNFQDIYICMYVLYICTYVCMYIYVYMYVSFYMYSNVKYILMWNFNQVDAHNIHTYIHTWSLWVVDTSNVTFGVTLGLPSRSPPM